MRLLSEVHLSTPRDRVFERFSAPATLESLSPPWVHCRMIGPAPAVMALGATIEYRFRLHGVPIRWVAGITMWNPPDVFVDEQVRGPYRRWTHTHTFVAKGDTTIVGDRIEFAAPGGKFIERWVVRDLRRIFLFRREALLRGFAEPQPWPEPRLQID